MKQKQQNNINKRLDWKGKKELKMIFVIYISKTF